MTRDFKGVWIPREIWLLEDLGWSEKILLVEIDSLNIDNKGCYASNDYLAKFLGVSKDRVSRMVSRLTKDGYLKTKILYKPGTKEVEKRLMWPVYATGGNTDTLPAETPIPPGENNDTPPGENNDTLPVETPKRVIQGSNTSLSNSKEGKKKGGKAATRRKYGQYENVLLSDEEMQKLQSEFPSDWEERIERLSEYIASSGKKYSSHLATIRSWARKDAEAPQRPRYGRKEPVPGWAKSGPRELDQDEIDAIKRVMAMDIPDIEEPRTAGNDPAVAAKAEDLQRRLGII